MKIYFSAVTTLLLVCETSAFTTSPFYRSTLVPNTAINGQATDSDLSIPYDAAARLAYDEWRETYDKGEFDLARFESFKGNYKILTVANISAAKKAKDAGDEEPKRMDLNEFADMSFDEYVAMNSGSSEAEVEDTGDVRILQTAMAGMEAQNAASTSLKEAADALAEEEQVRQNVICIICIRLLGKSFWVFIRVHILNNYMH